MSIRNIALVAASGLLLASPLAASAATTKTAHAAKPANPCKGLHGKALKTCKQNNKKTK